MGKKKKKEQQAEQAAQGKRVIVVNKKARFNYEIIDTFEAGLVLTGNEIKSIRAGGITLDEAYIRPQNDELWLLGAHIKEYKFSSVKDYDPVRPKKLLLHRYEIDKLRGRVEQKGLTMVATKVYLIRGKAKIELALAKGKAAPDKRQSIMEREQKRDAERAIKYQ